MANEKPKSNRVKDGLSEQDIKNKITRKKLYAEPVSIREFAIPGTNGMVKYIQEETFQNGVKKCHVIGNAKEGNLIAGRRAKEG